MDKSYHDSNSLSSRGYSDIVSGESRPAGARNPFAYEVTPPIGRLLDCISEHLSIGGCFRPGNRQLADWLGYASAGHIPNLLSQLACEGWIDYDPDTRLITLLRDYHTDQAIPTIEERSGDPIDRSDDDDSALIDRRDRDFEQQNAENRSIPTIDQLAQRMEDHVLVAAVLDSESAAARSKIPCSAESIPMLDHRAALLAELGTAPKLIAKALAKRPGLTPEQIRATWSHFEPRIKAGLCTSGAFHAAIANGQIHGPPPDPTRPLAPESYADNPAFRLGSQEQPDESAQRNAVYREAHWRAVDLLGPGAAFGDMRIVVEALVAGASDAQALAELRSEVPR